MIGAKWGFGYIWWHKTSRGGDGLGTVRNSISVPGKPLHLSLSHCAFKYTWLHSLQDGSVLTIYGLSTTSLYTYGEAPASPNTMH